MKKTIWILGDQLSLLHSGLAEGDRSGDVVLMVESRSRGAHLKYHKLKLVMIYAAMRHFANELRGMGWTVDYHSLADTPDFESAWARHIKKYKPQLVVMMEPNSWFETTMASRITASAGLDLEVKPSCQFLVPRGDFRSWAFGKKRLLMENHYRRLRVTRNILMTADGKPEGGAWNFDSENRATLADWKKSRKPPPRDSLLETAQHDSLVLQVATEVDRWFPEAFGSSSDAWAPVTRKQALLLLENFVSERLSDYGNYQDLMLEDSPGMFHSLISAPINIGLLDPMECVEAAVNAWCMGKAPLSAVEGFVRQIIGWREFVNGVYWLKMP
ncbi:MAG: cryptochrome/photolyase family protein, partial [Terrimicrobiaceae bacterium]